MKLIVEIDHDTTSIQFDEEGTMMIFRNLKKVPALTKDQLVLYFKGREAQSVDYGQTIDQKILKEADSLVTISVPWDIEGRELAQQMLEVWQKNALKTAGLFEEQKIAVNRYPIVARHQERLFELLTKFHFILIIIMQKGKLSGKSAMKCGCWLVRN